MIQGTQWPSFIIQGIILGADFWFLIERSSHANAWIFISILSVLLLFSLQTTSVGFLYLYPVEKNKEGNIRQIVGIDTWILRVLTMAALTFLYLGVLDQYPCWNKWWLIIPGIVLIFVVPVIFNMGISDWMREKATSKKVD